MAELILAILCIVIGVVFAGFALLGLFANAMGGVTNPSAVDLKPAAVCALIAVAGIAGGVTILVF